MTVQNQETNEIATAVTNADGAYTIPFLRPGLYTLTADLSGFQKYVRKDMRLEVSQSALVNVQLSVGGVTEQMTVTAESPLLQSSNADRGSVIDSHRIAELPLQSRSPMALARAGRRRDLQRAGDLPAAVRQRRARRLLDERRAEPQQRVHARRRPEQRQPGGQQRRLHPAGRRGAGVQGPDQFLRRAVRAHRRRRGQHVAEIGHQQLPRHRLRVLPPQVARRQLVPAQLAQHAEGGALSRSVRLRSRRSGADPRPVQRQGQDLLHVHRREVPRGHAGGAVQQRADSGDEGR